MKSRRKLWIGLLVLAGLPVLAVLLLPWLVDVDRYRGLIQQKAEAALGRPVQLGALHLSWLPFGVGVEQVGIGALPEEGAGDLLRAKSLRVGARLLPLLRGRLEAQTIVVDQPELTLVRGRDGRWNVQRVVAAAPSGTAKSETSFAIGSVVVRHGRVTVRDAGHELVLADVDLELNDVAPDRPLGLKLSTRLEPAPGARVRLEGTLGPLGGPPGTPLRLAGRLELSDVDPTQLAELIAAGGVDGAALTGLLGQRKFSVAAKVQLESATATTVRVEDLLVRDLEVIVRRDAAGRWNLGDLAGTGGTRGAAGPPSIELAGLRAENLRVGWRDETTTPPLELALDGLGLQLDRLPTAGPARLELETRIEAAGGRGRVELRGTVGPLDPGAKRLPVDVAAKLEDVPLTLLRPVLGGLGMLREAGGTAALDVQLRGDLAAEFDARGTVALDAARLELSDPAGRPRSVALELDGRFDLGVRDAGEALELRTLDLDLGGTRVALHGTVARDGPRRRIDLQLAPTRIAADRLAALLALAVGEPPVAFTSPTPIELGLRLRGTVGAGGLPTIDGSARLRDFSFRHSSMKQPIEKVSADVTFSGERVELRNLSGAVGASDLAGELTLVGFSRPRLRFDVHSRRADFWELFNFVESAPSPASAAGAAPAGETLLDRASAEGNVRIDAGSFQTVDFTGMEAHLRWADGVLTLDPVKMTLYSGVFSGRLTEDLRVQPPAFRINGEVEQLDMAGFLADNLELKDVLSGKFSGDVDLSGSGADYAAIVRSASGSGTVEVGSGRIGKLDVLGTLSKASGLFGERTLAALSGKIGRQGTDFSSLRSSLRVGSGFMRLEDVVLEAPDFALSGSSDVDLAAARLDGRFRLAFSDAISRSMREERSRAGEVFWNTRDERVELPLALAGPLSAPAPTIDWKQAASGMIAGKAEGKLRDLLGLKKEPAAPAAAPAAALPSPAAAPEVLAAEIRTARFGGGLLAPDLK
ncbi:MAG TPA: AsmA family protein, partial [Candidatus Polarisedimenticolaceae bacterium]|nr:AsmA family protein [Candidatus Polarisedimenticolaceae bacterium]